MEVSKTIVHICLGGPYTDGFTYQENILSKHHFASGWDVVIVASPLCYDESGKVVNSSETDYVNNDGIRVKRLPFSGGGMISKKIKRVRGLYKFLEEISPEVIFLHGVQEFAVFDVAKYAKQHSDVSVYVDNHVDDSNVGGKLHKALIDKTLWRGTTAAIAPYARKFYGVLPARVQFLEEVYRAPYDKCQLLPMGFDDLIVQDPRYGTTQVEVAKWLEGEGISDEDIIISTGGKIDSHKTQVLDLISEFVELSKGKDVHLVIFGSVDPSIMGLFEKKISSSANLHYFGWANSCQMTALIEKSSAMVFPGRHSVLWEQSAGQGKPLLVKKWDGYDHLDFGANVMYFESDSVSEIREKTRQLIQLCREVEVCEAASIAKPHFQYSVISKLALEA